MKVKRSAIGPGRRSGSRCLTTAYSLAIEVLEATVEVHHNGMLATDITHGRRLRLFAATGAEEKDVREHKETTMYELPMKSHLIYIIDRLSDAFYD